MPLGKLNRATAPVPSVVVKEFTVPASVVTRAPGIVTWRMTELLVSAMKRLVPKAAMPFGLLKRAAVPVASVEAKLPAKPAKVETTPPRVTLRTMC